MWMAPSSLGMCSAGMTFGSRALAGTTVSLPRSVDPSMGGARLESSVRAVKADHKLSVRCDHIQPGRVLAALSTQRAAHTRGGKGREGPR